MPLRPLVLVVDDNADARELYTLLLGASGYRTREAVDGLDALAQAGIETPDAILMDMAMPRMDGVAATRALRRDARYVDTPIMAITGQGDDAAGEMVAAGCDAVCIKPCNPDQIAAWLAAQLAARH